MAPPTWLDEHGQRAPTRPCHVPGCTREWPIRRYRFEHLPWTGWPTTPMVVVNWCGHGQDFIRWPEADGYWRLPAGEPLSQT